jgi:hypothetical protein
MNRSSLARSPSLCAASPRCISPICFAFSWLRASSRPVARVVCDPQNHDNNIKALALATVVLVRPHAVRLLVPVRGLGAVHTATAAVRLAVGARGGGLGARGGGRRAVRASSGVGPPRLVKLGRRDEVLHDRAVDGELVGRGTAGGGRRLVDQGLEDGVLAWKEESVS